MKKFILVIAALVAVSGLSFAQETTVTTDNRTKTHKTSSKTVDVWYQGEVNLGYVLDTDSESADCSRPYITTIHGVRITKYAFVGIGVGFQYEYGECEDPDVVGETRTRDTGVIPIYLNVKGYYPVNDKFAPYVSCSLGGHVDFGDFIATRGRLFDEIGVGFKYRKLNFGLGLQQVYSTWRAENGVYFNVGLVF